MTENRRRHLVWVYGILLLTPLFFASNVVFGRAAVVNVAPATLAFWRWLLAGLAMLPFAWSQLPTLKRLGRLSPTLLVAAALGMGICGAGVYWSLQHTTATKGVLLYTTSPAMVALIEEAAGRRRLSLAAAAGIVLATIGVAVIVTEGAPDRLRSFDFNIGDLGFLIAALSWAIYSLLLRNSEVVTLGGIGFFTLTALFGALVNLPFWLIEGRTHGHLPHGVEAWTSIGLIVAISSILSFLSYQYSVRQVGPAQAAMFMYLLPVFGVALAALFLGEAVAAYHFAGSALVIGGVVIATLARARPQQGASR